MSNLHAANEQHDSPDVIASMLRAGRCPPDSAFDGYLPPALQEVSSVFWSPLMVAVQAAQWLEQHELRTVVDIGSGPGKFCVATALASSARFIGLEQRPHLVDASVSLARAFGVADRVSFRQGTFGHTPLPVADLYYLYNPFGENLFGGEAHLDERVELSPARFLRDVTTTERLLRDLDVGAHVLVYNGFGGRFSTGWREVCVDRTLPSPLCLWKKTGPID